MNYQIRNACFTKREKKQQNNKQMELIKNQECFAIVQDNQEQKTYVAIGHTIIAEAQSVEHAEELIETKDWRLIVGLTSLIAKGTLEELTNENRKENDNISENNH